MRRHGSRWLGLWYGTISLGFVLLAVNRAIMVEKAWLIGVRAVIAIGFALLAALELRTRS